MVIVCDLMQDESGDDEFDPDGDEDDEDEDIEEDGEAGTARTNSCQFSRGVTENSSV